MKNLPEAIYDAAPDWIKLYDLAWRSALKNIEYPTREGWLTQMSCMPGSGKIWQWDSCFMAIFAKYSNGTINAVNNLDNLYRLQREDGYISMTYLVETEQEAFGERINPPLFAWVEWKHYRFGGDKARLERVFPILKRYYHWLKGKRRRNNGLYWFEDSGSSGMDNSPRSGYPAAGLTGSDICFIDLACQQALSAGCLAEIAETLGLTAEADDFRREKTELSLLINRHHWSERFGFYYDIFTGPGNFLACKTVAAFWTIVAGVADARQLVRLKEHLLDADEFGTHHPVPSLAKDDPNYDPAGSYWCGGVWAPTNYMVVDGLKQRGAYQLARTIAVKHLAAMTEVMNDPALGGIWECYSPEYPLPATKNRAGLVVRNNFVGWSGLGPIAMLIEHVIGLAFDVPENTICWHISATCRHGLRKLVFNGGEVSLLCHGLDNPGKTRIEVETDRKLTLKVSLEGRSRPEPRVYELDAGRHAMTP